MSMYIKLAVTAATSVSLVRTTAEGLILAVVATATVTRGKGGDCLHSSLGAGASKPACQAPARSEGVRYGAAATVYVTIPTPSIDGAPYDIRTVAEAASPGGNWSLLRASRRTIGDGNIVECIVLNDDLSAASEWFEFQPRFTVAATAITAKSSDLAVAYSMATTAMELYGDQPPCGEGAAAALPEKFATAVADEKGFRRRASRAVAHQRRGLRLLEGYVDPKVLKEISDSIH